MISLRDAVYGAAIGDAVGVPWEFKLRGSFECKEMCGYGTHNQPWGTWSDDTSMMLCICDSIRENNGKIDISDIRKKFCAWAFKNTYSPDNHTFDIGQTVASALMAGRGRTGEYDNGNGSLMRTLPLAFTEATDEEIEAVSAITHAHQVSMQACVCYVHIARALNAGISLMGAIQANIPEHSAFRRLATLSELPESEIQSGGFVIHTLEAALWCLLKTQSYEECVLKAVNLGDDTDTTACVAGGLAVILYGFENIPAHWVEGLRAKDLIDSCMFS